ncbi:MAG: phosphotransferase [Bifidobacterium sp.]|jgi:hypothetical protein|nr:phosphotransferase [Bifidobacterium sp.]MCH4175535.1 phosphotransferase [Bifidobacterium sp.]
MESKGNPQLDMVVQRWPDVDLAQAQALCSSLSEPVVAQRILSHSARPTAAASLVSTNVAPIFIKRYDRAIRDTPSITPYHRYAEYLGDHGITAPRFLHFNSQSSTAFSVDSSNDTVAVQGNAAFECYVAVEGEDRYAKALSWDSPSDLEEAHELGSYVASIDCASVGFAEARLPINGMSNTFGMFASGDIHGSLNLWLNQRPLVRRYLELTQRDIAHDVQVVEPYAGRVGKLYQTLPARWTHGDPHISNFLWHGKHPSAVIDFGLSDQNTAIFELAMLLERHCIQWVDIMDGNEAAYRPDVAAALITGYCTVRPLSDIERLILPDILAICQAEAGLNWLQYYMKLPNRLQDADWCYDSCFLAHTRWFSTPSGQSLLRDIRECLEKCAR